MKKRFVIAILLLALLLPTITAVPAAAAANKAVAARYVNIVSIAPGISVTGTTAKYSCSIIGASNVTSITAVFQIQKQNTNGSYSDFGSSWTESSKTSYLYASGTKTVDSGYTYRLKVTVTAVSDVTSTEIAYS